MALIECPNCKKIISSDYVFCPNCGGKVELQPSKNEDDEIAKADVPWTKEMNEKFQDIHYVVSGGRKKVIIITIIYTLFFIIPGLLFYIFFKLFRKSQINNVYKMEMKNFGGSEKTMSYLFHKDYFEYSDGKTSSVNKYQDFKVIALKDNAITFLTQAMNSGFYIPLDKISNKKELLDIVSKLNNYKEY